MYVKLLRLLHRLLALFPFDGDKSKLGGLLVVISYLSKYLPPDVLLQFIDGKLAALGLPVLFLGLIHKLIKRLLDEAS